VRPGPSPAAGCSHGAGRRWVLLSSEPGGPGQQTRRDGRPRGCGWQRSPWPCPCGHRHEDGPAVSRSGDLGSAAGKGALRAWLARNMLPAPRSASKFVRPATCPGAGQDPAALPLSCPVPVVLHARTGRARDRSARRRPRQVLSAGGHAAGSPARPRLPRVARPLPGQGLSQPGACDRAVTILGEAGAGLFTRMLTGGTRGGSPSLAPGGGVPARRTCCEPGSDWPGGRRLGASHEPGGPRRGRAALLWRVAEGGAV